MKQLCFSPFIPDDPRIFSSIAIALRQDGKWVFFRSSEAKAAEFLQGTSLLGESPEAAAQRILFSHLGTHIRILQIEILDVFSSGPSGSGLLVFSEIAVSPLPENCISMDFPPLEPKDPDLFHPLFQRVQRYLNMRSGAGELWDIYDQNRKLTGRLHRRGEILSPGDYHLAVHVWLRQKNGDFLLAKRSLNKGFPGLWECPGGSALAGDDSLHAALREVKEETGFSLDPEKGRLILQYQREQYFCDVWCFEDAFPLENVRLLPAENCDVCHRNQEDILQLHKDGLLVPYCYLEEFFASLFLKETVRIQPKKAGI